MALLAFGINHKTAPLELREKLAFNSEQLPQALQALRLLAHLHEVVILSTCNRTEIYCIVAAPVQLDSWLGNYYQLPAEILKSCLYEYQDIAAVRHIMRVASGLDSMILGEPQILGQLKSAVLQAKVSETLGTQLQHLFQWVFATTKRIRHDTKIGVNPISVAYAAVHLARRIFADLGKRNALLIGAGATIKLAGQYLQSQGIQKILLTSRNAVKAQLLGEAWKAHVFPLEQLPQHLAEADIVIAATSSDLPLLGKGSVETALKQRKRQPMLMLDIAVPRDIEPEVASLSDVYLYNIDDLQTIVADNLKYRQAAALQAEQLIEIEVAHFMRQMQARAAVPLIRAYRSQITDLRQQALKQAMQALMQGTDPTQIMHNLAHTLTNKIMHGPSTQLHRIAYEGNLTGLDLARQLLGIKE